MRMCMKRKSTSKTSSDGLLYGHTRIAVGKKKVDWVGVVTDPKGQGGSFRIQT